MLLQHWLRRGPAICYGTQSDRQYSNNNETIRLAQRECLKRTPAHTFYLVQTPGGYLIACEPLKAATP